MDSLETEITTRNAKQSVGSVDTKTVVMVKGRNTFVMIAIVNFSHKNVLLTIKRKPKRANSHFVKSLRRKFEQFVCFIAGLKFQVDVIVKS